MVASPEAGSGSGACYGLDDPGATEDGLAWTIAVLLVGVVLGLGVVGYAVWRAWTGRWVPPWLPTVGALLILVAARRSFKDVTAASTPETWAAHLDLGWWIGSLYVGLGAVMALAGVVGPRDHRRSPALVLVGTTIATAGLVWAAWTHGEADLWRAWDAPRVVLEGVRADAEQRLRGAFLVSLALASLVGIPGAIWAFLRGAWVGIGEGIAAAVVVAVVLGTGQPAREAVVRATEPWMRRCDGIAQAGVVRPPGDVAWDGRPLVRVGPTGEEVWTEVGWREAPWPEGPIGVVVSPRVDADRLAGWLDGRTDVLLAGYSPPDDIPRLFGRHPVLASAGCRASRWSADRSLEASSFGDSRERGVSPVGGGGSTR